MVQSWHDAPPRTKRIEPFSPVLLPADDIFLISMADYLSRESKIEFSGLAKLPPERDQVREALDQLPLPIVEAPTETGRMKLLKVVANIAKLSGREFQLVWNAIYDDFRIRCHIDLKARSRHDIRKRKPLDIAEDEGLIERLYAIAHEHLTRIQRIQEVA